MKETRPHGMPRLRDHALPIGLLLLLTLLFFSDLIFLGRIWFDAPSLLRLYPWRADSTFTLIDALQKDFTGYTLPYYLFMVQSLFEEGVFPLWNPYVLMGVPAFGEGTTKVLSPLNAIHFLFNLPTALSVRVVLQVFLCGIFMYGYLYSLTRLRLPALMGAVAFMFSGFILGKTYSIHIDGYYLTPLGLLLVDRALRRGGFRPWIPVSLVLWGIVIGSFAPFAPHPLLLIGAYALFRIATQARVSWAAQGRPLLYLVAAVLIAGLLSAVELLPFRAILAESTRLGALRPASEEGLAPGIPARMFAWGLFNFSFSVRLPLFFHMVARNWTYFGALSLFVLAMGYLLGWRRGLQKHSAVSKGCQAFFLGAVLFGLGNFYLAPFLAGLLPGLFGRLPDLFHSFLNYRSLFLVAVGFSVLLANGFYVLYLSEASWKRDRLLRLTNAVTLGGAAAGAILVAVGQSHWLEKLVRTHQIWLGLATLGVVSSIHLIRLPRGVPRPWMGGAILALLFIELWVAERSLFSAYPKALFYPSPPPIHFFRDSLGPHRVASLGGTWNSPQDMFQSPPTMNVLLPYRIRTLDGFSSVAPRRTLELLEALQGRVHPPRSGALANWVIITTRSVERSPLLDVLGVKYLLASHGGDDLGYFFNLRMVYDDEMKILENPRALPRVFFVPRGERVQNAEDGLKRLTQPGFDPRRVVLLEGPVKKGDASSVPVGGGVARIVEEGLHHVAVETTAETSGYVVLADTYFPGWHATVDGLPAPIERAHHALRAVAVTSGTHRVRFDYWPPGLTPGLWVTSSTLAGLALFVGFSIGRGRPRRRKFNGRGGVARTLLLCSLLGLVLVPEAKGQPEKQDSTPPSVTGEMVLIPAGSFLYGMGEQEDSRYLPAFLIDKYEVTNQQYEVSVKATGRKPPRYWKDSRFNGPNHPVVGVSWYDARDYCAWARKRLPSEAEWEKAARGTDGRPCPWGREDCAEYGGLDRANHAVVRYLFLDWLDVVFNADGYRHTAPVGSFPKGVSPYGVHDLAGNVWEWIGEATLRRGDDTQGNQSLGRKLQRGGAWSTLWFTLYTYHRRWSQPELDTSSSVGFRCAKDP